MDLPVEIRHMIYAFILEDCYLAQGTVAFGKKARQLDLVKDEMRMISQCDRFSVPGLPHDHRLGLCTATDTRVFIDHVLGMDTTPVRGAPELGFYNRIMPAPLAPVRRMTILKRTISAEVKTMLFEHDKATVDGTVLGRPYKRQDGNGESTGDTLRFANGHLGKVAISSLSHIGRLHIHDRGTGLVPRNVTRVVDLINNNLPCLKELIMGLGSALAFPNVTAPQMRRHNKTLKQAMGRLAILPPRIVVRLESNMETSTVLEDSSRLLEHTHNMNRQFAKQRRAVRLLRLRRARHKSRQDRVDLDTLAIANTQRLRALGPRSLHLVDGRPIAVACKKLAESDQELGRIRLGIRVMSIHERWGKH